MISGLVDKNGMKWDQELCLNCINDIFSLKVGFCKSIIPIKIEMKMKIMKINFFKNTFLYP